MTKEGVVDLTAGGRLRFLNLSIESRTMLRTYSRMNVGNLYSLYS